MKRIGMIAGTIIVIVLLLGGAAFVGGQLFRQGQEAQANASVQGPPQKLVTPATGVPTSSPDANGDALRRDGNSIFVCESNSGITINQNGTVNESGTCTTQVEVVVGHDTAFIHDVSALRNPSPAKQGDSVIIQQYTEPGSETDIGEGTAVRAWGSRSGNRVIARTILYWNRSPVPSGTPGS